MANSFMGLNPNSPAFEGEATLGENAMFDDEPTPKAPDQPEIGGDLSRLSVADLEERIVLLRQEIARTEEILSAKQSSRAAAEAVFGN